MAYTIPKDAVIDYEASALREFRVYGYEWIDDLHFVRPPGEFLASPEQLPQYLAVARERFLGAGWHGDGDIGLLWLPPFVFSLAAQIPTQGVVVWHVKQEQDGVSWILSPIELPFETLES